MRQEMLKKSQHGFTLMELMLAVAILMIAITGLLATYIYGILMNTANKNLIIATNDAQYIMEQIKGVDYGNITNYDPPDFYNLDSETISLSRNIGTAIAQVTVTVNWHERQTQRNLSVTTYIAK